MIKRKITMLFGLAVASMVVAGDFAVKVLDASESCEKADVKTLYALRNDAPSQKARELLVVACCLGAIGQGNPVDAERYAMEEFGEDGLGKVRSLCPKECPQCKGVGVVPVKCGSCDEGKCPNPRCENGMLPMETLKGRSHLENEVTRFGTRQRLGSESVSQSRQRCTLCKGSGKCKKCLGRGMLPAPCGECKGQKTIFDQQAAAKTFKDKVADAITATETAEKMLNYVFGSGEEESGNAMSETIMAFIGSHGQKSDPKFLSEIYRRALGDEKKAQRAFASLLLNGFIDYQRYVKGNRKLDEQSIGSWLTEMPPEQLSEENEYLAMDILLDFGLDERCGLVADHVALRMIPVFIDKRDKVKWERQRVEYARANPHSDAAAQYRVAFGNVRQSVGGRVQVGTVQEGIWTDLNRIKREEVVVEEFKKQIQDLAKRHSKVASHFLKTGVFAPEFAIGENTKEPPKRNTSQMPEPIESIVKPLDFDFSVISDDQVTHAVKLLSENCQKTYFRVFRRYEEHDARFSEFRSTMKTPLSAEEKAIGDVLKQNVDVALRDLQIISSQNTQLVQYIERAAKQGNKTALFVVSHPSWKKQ